MESARRPDTEYHPGQLSYLGRHYDVHTEDGTPLGVLVVPMETGRAREHVTLDMRREEVAESAALPFRSRNPHMRGVTLALRLAFGCGLGEDRDGEYLSTPHGPVHLFDAFAMANLLLCSAVKTGSTRSSLTAVLRDHCSRHLEATIGALAPTLVISQGKPLSPTLGRLFTVEQQHGPHVYTCSLQGVRFYWADLFHPTHTWDWLARPYLHEVAAPAIRQARGLALIESRREGTS